MTLLARIMEWIFLGAWCVGAGAFFYACWYWYARKSPEPSKRQRRRRNLILGWGVFFGALAVEFAAGMVAELAGGWR